MATMAAVPFIAFRVPAAPAGAAMSRNAVAAFAAEHGADAETLTRVRLAASEALNNAILHAYDGSPGSVEIEADVEGGDLEVVISDSGQGFRPGSSPGMGLGLMVIERCCDAFLVRNRLPQGVEVWMRFALA